MVTGRAPLKITLPIPKLTALILCIRDEGERKIIIIQKSICNIYIEQPGMFHEEII